MPCGGVASRSSLSDHIGYSCWILQCKSSKEVVRCVHCIFDGAIFQFHKFTKHHSALNTCSYTIRKASEVDLEGPKRDTVLHNQKIGNFYKPENRLEAT